MSPAFERFDPYYTWLGIPPSEQPPNFYRLLGLQLFEANLPVIENAADRQMKHLRSFQIGARAADSQRLLNEVSTARIQLLDPARKAAYDEQLQRKLAAPLGSPADSGIAIQRREAEKRQVRRSPPAKSVKSVVKIIGIVVGGIVGLAMGVMIVFYLTGQDLLGLSGRMRTPPEPPAVVIAPPVEVPKVKRKLPKVVTVPLPSTQRQEHPRPTPEIPPPPPAPPSQSAATPAIAEPAPPVAAATPIAPVARAAGPLVARLPVLISSEPAPLFPLSADPADPLEIAFHSGAADIPAKSSIVAERVASEQEWTVTHIREAESAAATKEPLGTIQRGPSELLFAWKTPLADAPARRQLANCLLEIRHGSEPKFAQLRDVAKSQPLVLDFQRTSQTVEIDVDDLPAYGKIVLKIHDLSNFARGGKLRGDTRTLTLGKTSFIDFSEMPGAEVKLRFVRAPTGGGLLLRADPVFQEKSGRDFELTFSSLEKQRAEVERLVANMQTELVNLKSRLATARSSLRNLPPTATRPQIVAAVSLAASLEQQIAPIERTLPAHQARLDAVPSVKAFMDFLHERATIQFSVCAIAGDKEIVLAESGR